MTGRAAECPLDEMNRPCASVDPYQGTTGTFLDRNDGRYVHATHVEDAWLTGQQRAADRWKGLAP